MGWRDINMSRRKPQRRVTFVPMEPGMDRHQAVLRKAASDAVAAAMEQLGEGQPAGSEPFAGFFAGYVLGFARVVAAKNGIDGDVAGDTALADAIAGSSPAIWKSALELDASGAMREAGALVGRLEAQCGSRKLLGLACDRMKQKDAGSRFLTDCDVAADPMQTRLPTLTLRFHGVERRTILDAFKEIDDA